jgi:hypothetical protein
MLFDFTFNNYYSFNNYDYIQMHYVQINYTAWQNYIQTKLNWFKFCQMQRHDFYLILSWFSNFSSVNVYSLRYWFFVLNFNDK